MPQKFESLFMAQSIEIVEPWHTWSIHSVYTGPGKVFKVLILNASLGIFVKRTERMVGVS